VIGEVLGNAGTLDDSVYPGTVKSVRGKLFHRRLQDAFS
jgi:hypothetical protein